MAFRVRRRYLQLACEHPWSVCAVTASYCLCSYCTLGWKIAVDALGCAWDETCESVISFPLRSLSFWRSSPPVPLDKSPRLSQPWNLTRRKQQTICFFPTNPTLKVRKGCRNSSTYLRVMLTVFGLLPLKASHCSVSGSYCILTVVFRATWISFNPQSTGYHIQGVPGGMCQTSGGCSLC